MGLVHQCYQGSPTQTFAAPQMTTGIGCVVVVVCRIELLSNLLNQSILTRQLPIENIKWPPRRLDLNVYYGGGGKIVGSRQDVI